jgi:ubiquitin-protein ligase
MLNSPRTRRLFSDAKAIAQLAAESSIFSFQPYGSPPDFYILRFSGRGIWKRNPQDEPIVRDEHEVHIRLGASYPRMMPELAWKSPIFHPNISASGVVCLGGYGTYWVPSLALDELCGMLWDMVRYENYDETSPYNREAAAWAKNQTSFRLPLDQRPLRDKLNGFAKHGDSLGAAKPALAATPSHEGFSPLTARLAQPSAPPARFRAASPSPAPAALGGDVLFLGDVEIVQAEAVPPQRSRVERDVLYIE